MQSDSTPHPTLPRSEAPSPECSEVDDDLEDGNDFDFLNHFDSLKADFQQVDVEDWSDDDDDEAGGDMDELMELCRGDLTEIMVNMMLEEDPNDLEWMPEKLKNKAAKRKANFAAAKERALQVLDACPVEVIRWFINSSRRFVEAYRSGPTGKAAAWAVKKQKQHRAVSERAMVAMENVNTSA